jgi:hypothetical protein
MQLSISEDEKFYQNRFMKSKVLTVKRKPVEKGDIVFDGKNYYKVTYYTVCLTEGRIFPYGELVVSNNGSRIHKKYPNFTFQKRMRYLGNMEIVDQVWLDNVINCGTLWETEIYSKVQKELDIQKYWREKYGK